MLSKFETSTVVEYISIKLELVGIKDLRKGNSRSELINIIPSQTYKEKGNEKKKTLMGLKLKLKFFKFFFLQNFNGIVKRKNTNTSIFKKIYIKIAVTFDPHLTSYA